MHTAYPIIQPFINYLKFEKRFSQHTVISYETDLISFFDYVHITYGETPLSQISHVYIRSWLANLKNKDMSAKSLNRKISTLRSFFKYQLKTGVVQQTPMVKIIAPKNEKRLPSFVSKENIDTLLRHVEFGKDWKGQTEKLMISIFYSTGMRLSELINLKESSVNYSTHTVKVLGKGNKERVIPISKELVLDVKEYIFAKRHTNFELENDILLTTEKGKKLSSRSVYASVKRHLSSVTTIEKRSPHVLRHSFATHLMNNGADLNAVKELLGHSSLAATQVYTHNTIDKLKNIHKQAHPKA